MGLDVKNVVGVVVSCCVGAVTGDSFGISEEVASSVSSGVGALEGNQLGWFVGKFKAAPRSRVGELEGALLPRSEEDVGAALGAALGFSIGAKLGCCDGAAEGPEEGICVGK